MRRDDLLGRVGNVFADAARGQRVTRFLTDHWDRLNAPSPLASSLRHGGTDSQADSRLNELVGAFAMGRQHGMLRVTLADDKPGQLFHDLVLHHRHRHPERGEHHALREATGELFARLPNAYRDSPEHERRQFVWDVRRYWDHQGGGAEAARLARLAEVRFDAENRAYNESLDTLATGLARGATLEDEALALHLRRVVSHALLNVPTPGSRQRERGEQLVEQVRGYLTQGDGAKRAAAIAAQARDEFR